jgi:hypothetical protein
MIIPIGVDCGLADLLRKNNLRTFAFPFDWCVTYNGVSEIIKDDFNKFIPELNNNKKSEYNINFFHDFDNNYSLDKEKYLRRINRFKNILENSKEEIIFIRKGHAYHHHQESNNIKNDIEDANNLDNILQEKYKNLSYKIIVILVCGTCFDINNNYLSNNKRIEIYNISTPSVDDKKFEQKFNELFVLKV